MKTLTRGPSLSPIKGVNFYRFLISASLSAIPLILHKWLLMITLINNSQKVVPDLHASMNASMNLNRFNMSFYCDDFFDKEIKWVKLPIIAWVARGIRLQKGFLSAERQGIFFPFFLQLYSQIHFLGVSEVFVFSLVWQIPLFSQATKKAPSINWIPVKWWVYQGDFSHWEAFIPRDFVWLNSPTWENVQFCCTHFTIPLVSLGAKPLGQAKDICTTITNNHHHLIIYLTKIHHQILLTVFTWNSFWITDPNFHIR